MKGDKTGLFITELRKEKGYTQKELAEKLGVSDKAVSRWETGKGLPDTSLLGPLSELLQVTVGELLEGHRNIEDDSQNNSDEYTDEQIEQGNGDKRSKFIFIAACIGCFIIGILVASFVIKGGGRKEEPDRTVTNAPTATSAPITTAPSNTPTLSPVPIVTLTPTPTMTPVPTIATTIKDDFYNFTDADISFAVNAALEFAEEAFDKNTIMPDCKITEIAYPGNYNHRMQKIWEKYSNKNVVYEKGEVIMVALHVEWEEKERYFSDAESYYNENESAALVVLGRESNETSKWKCIDFSPLESWWAITNCVPLEYLYNADKWDFVHSLSDYSSMNEKEKTAYWEFTDEEVMAAVKVVVDMLKTEEAEEALRPDTYYQANGSAHCDKLEIFYDDNDPLKQVATGTLNNASEITRENGAKKIRIYYRINVWCEEGVSEGPWELGNYWSSVWLTRTTTDSLEWTIEEWSKEPYAAGVPIVTAEKFEEMGYKAAWNYKYNWLYGGY